MALSTHPSRRRLPSRGAGRTPGRAGARHLLPLLLLGLALSGRDVGAQPGVDVLTHHNDTARTGQALGETILTPANVNVATFGKVGLLTVDGKVDAQPLYVSALAIPGQGNRNVLYVATEHDSVFAFDVDSTALLWQQSLLGPGETTSDRLGCTQVAPEIGVTATPVIDRSRGPSGALYVVAMSKDSSGRYFQRLHALDLTTGAELFGGPATIAASFPGTGAGSVLGTVLFDPRQYEERAALLMAGGTLYTTWTSHCDIDPYTGWIIAYDPATLAQVSVLNVTPNGSRGAIWMSGGGPAADAAGNIYFLDGNGTFDTTLDARGFPDRGDFGNAFIKLSPAPGLAVADYFATSDTVTRSALDSDLGSGGVLVLPDLTDAFGQIRHLALGVGKDRRIFVADRDLMGRWNADFNDVYQELDDVLGGSVFSVPAYFDNTVYIGAVNDGVKAFPVSSARIGPTWSSQTSPHFPYPGVTPSISANGTANAILWAVENNTPAALHAFDARDLSHELYDSSQAPDGRDQFGSGNKFITPTIANGRVYVGTPTGVAVFGLLLSPPGAPANLRVDAIGSSVTLTWDAPVGGDPPTSYLVEVGTGPGLADLGVFPTGSIATSLSATDVPAGTYFVRVRGQNAAGGGSASNEVALVLGVPGPSTSLASSSEGSAVTLTWEPPTLGGQPTSYVIEVGSGPGLADVGVFPTGTAATTLSATDVPAGTYYVRVRAQNAAGTGVASNEIVITVTG